MGRRDRRRGGDGLTATDPPDELVDEAADELYGLPPEQFTAARDEKAREARDGGDRKLAAALSRLRKPTVSAWVLNLLVRDQPEVGEQLVSLGQELRRAQAQLSGDALRELAAQRQRLVTALVRSARKLAAAAGHRVTAGTALELEQTLHAALADPAVAAEVSSGRLVKPTTRTGFSSEAPTAPSPPAKPRLRVVRDGEAAGQGKDPAAAREQARREQERERLRTESTAADQARTEADQAHGQATDRLAEAERVRAEAADAVEELSRRLAEAEDAERGAVRAEREARRGLDSAERRRDAARRRAVDLAARLSDLED